MCRSRKSHLIAGSNSSAALCGIKSEPTDDTHSKVNVPMYVNGVKANALIDTGSTLSHLSREFYKRLKVDLQNSDCSIAGVCNLFHWGATFEIFNNVEGQSPSNMYKIIKCYTQPGYYRRYK